MKIQVLKTNRNHIYVVPLGDLHVGSLHFTKKSEEKLRGYVKWIKNTPGAYTVLMGDLINCATLGSPSNPFEQNMDLSEQIETVVELLKPIKHKILGAISGNHESRLEGYAGYNPTISICDRLGVYYLGYDGVIIFRLGCHSSKKGKQRNPRATFSGYFHHTTGGGSTIGGKINRVDKLRDIVVDADFYCGAHNHLLGCVHTAVRRINPTKGTVDELRQMIIDTGGYLSYDGSYANKKQLPPLKLGSPRIRLAVKRKKSNGKEIVTKDIHVSL